MSDLLSRPKRTLSGGLALAGIAAVTAVIHYVVVNPRAFLNFYYLPVVFAAYTLGLRRGVYFALLACGAVGALAVATQSRFFAPDVASGMRWLELATWGCFLVLISYLVGWLYEARARQVGELKEAYRGILEIMSKFIDSVDRYTENHSRRVADYAAEIARALGLSEAEVEDIRVGAFLHDIGKVDISVEVLRKAARLTPDEMDEMRRHVDKGEHLVRSMGGILKHVLPLVAYHHERWDGTGYKGLRGEDIPLGARIIAVADTYDAILTDRAYRKGQTREQATRIVQDASGTQFDPQVVEVFMQLYGGPVEAVAIKTAA